MRRVKVESAREGKSMREFFVMALEMKLRRICDSTLMD